MPLLYNTEYRQHYTKMRGNLELVLEPYHEHHELNPLENGGDSFFFIIVYTFFFIIVKNTTQ